MSISKYITLSTILVVTLALALVVNTYGVELQELTISKNLTVSTWKDITFSATDTLKLYIPPGVYGEFKVKVIAENPGSSDAGIKVSADCLNKPSVEFVVPAGGSASGELVFEIPTPATSYIICTLTANVSNVTGIGITQMIVPNSIKVSYNETHFILSYDLFTIPYIEVGGEIKYFDGWLVDIVLGSPASGYTLTTMLNASATATFSDSKITLNSISIETDKFRLNITDTYPYTGRNLGSVTVTLTINQKTLNLIIHPKYDVEISSATWVEPKTTQFETIDGQAVSIAILRAPAKVYDSAGNSYKINFTISKIIYVEGLPSYTLSEAYVDGYNLTYLANIVPANGTTIKVFALIETASGWFEPAYVEVPIIVRPINVTFTPPKPTRDLTGFPTLEFKLVSGSKVLDGRYIEIDVVGNGKTIHKFIFDVFYAATVTAGSKSKYINVTSLYPINDSVIETDTSGDVPLVNITLIAYYDKPYDEAEFALFVPGAGGSDLTLSVAKVVPIEANVKYEVYKSVDYVDVYVLVNKKPNGNYRAVKVPVGIGSTMLTPGIYRLTVPIDFNATIWTLDVSALIEVFVRFVDGKIAKGVNVDLYRDTTKILSTVTDEIGRVVIDPYYGSYKVEAWLLYEGSKVSVSKTFVLDDDKEIMLTLPIPKPKPTIQSVVLSIPSRVEVNKTVNAIVSVRVAPIPEEPIMYSGTLTCSGPTPISRVFNVTLLAGQSETSEVIPIIFTKEGTYTCIAIVSKVTSSKVVVEVVKPSPAMIFPERPAWFNYLIILIMVLVVIALIAAIIRLLTPRERIHVVKW